MKKNQGVFDHGETASVKRFRSGSRVQDLCSQTPLGVARLSALLFCLIVIFLSRLAPALASNREPCETRKPLTNEEEHTAMMFSAELSWLERLRGDADKNGITYQKKLDQILLHNEPKFQSPALKDFATELLLFEQFKQILFLTVGLNSPEFREFTRMQRAIEYFHETSPRELRESTINLQRRIVIWSESEQRGRRGQDQQSVIEQTENTLTALNALSITLAHRMDANSEALDEKMLAYRQYLITAAGAVGAVGTLVVSSPVVAGASASLGATGLVLAGCGLGGVGAGAAAVLQTQYAAYSAAWLASYRHGTSYACELRAALESAHETIWQAFRAGTQSGAVAGCAFASAGLIAPKLTVYVVAGAVSVAATAEVGSTVNNAYLSTRSYLIYRSLLSLQKAENSADNLDESKRYLEQAQGFAQAAGRHALNAVLVGMVLVGGPAEVRHAIATGREAMIAMIGKSADNAAIALNMIGLNEGNSSK